jgi:hypothetical protein
VVSNPSLSRAVAPALNTPTGRLLNRSRPITTADNAARLSAQQPVGLVLVGVSSTEDRYQIEVVLVELAVKQ